MEKIHEEYKRKVFTLVHLAIFSGLLLTIVNTILFEGHDGQYTFGQQLRTRTLTPWSHGRRMQGESTKQQASETFDSAALTDRCFKLNSTDEDCPPGARQYGCCSCDSEYGGCTCEAHYRRYGRKRLWDKCVDEENGQMCTCTQAMTSAKAAVKAAAGAVAGSSTGTKLGYQFFGALFYWFMFIKRGPKERGQRVQYGPKAFVPHEMLGPLFDNAWRVGSVECCADCTGSIMNLVLFTPRMATTWWAISVVTTKNPAHAWLWSFAQVFFCFPCFPIIGLIRRGRIREIFRMAPDFGTDCFCWVCCPPLMICQEARMVDNAQGYNTGCCGLKNHYVDHLGPCNLIVNDGKRQDAVNAAWNQNFIGQPCKGKLLIDGGNLFGAHDFSIDCTGSIVLMSRGEVSFTTKINNAAKAGAIAVVVFNDKDKAEDKTPLLTMPNDPGAPAPTIPAAFVSKETGTGFVVELDKSVLTVELQFGLELKNDLMQVELQRAMDTENGKVLKSAFGGFLKEGIQFVPGGNMAGTTAEEIMAGIKKHEKFPAAAIFAPGGSRTDTPKQESMA